MTEKKKKAHEGIRLLLARQDLLEFTKRTKPDYEVNFHHEIMCNYLERFAFGDIKRLMIFMPPRHGKSEIVSRRLPAYILGRNPNANIIASSYGADLASRLNRDTQRIIDDPMYYKIFPNTTLSRSNVRSNVQGNYLRNSDIFEIVGHSGSYKSAGVGGAITGMGMDYGIIDDPYKNRQDADSETVRRTIWDWYISTFYTRLEKNGRILITLTRWHEDDLAGRLIKLAEENKNSDQWTILNFPAIAEGNLMEEDTREFGQALWRNKYNENDLKNIKTIIGSYEWSALYMGNPSNPEGRIFKREWWKYYKELPKLNEMILSADCTFKDHEDTDFVVIQVWGRAGIEKYLIYELRDRMDLPTTMNAIRMVSARYPLARKKLIEDSANGPAVIQMLRKEISGLIPITAKGSKVARANAVTPTIEAGNVYIPDPSGATWVLDYIEELSSFPNAKYDDRVDTTSQALNYFLKNEYKSRSFKPVIDEFEKTSTWQL